MRTRKHPSGRILGFEDQFVLKIHYGVIRQTIRTGQLWRVGMVAHLYEKPRQPGMALIFRAPVVKVEEIEIFNCGVGACPIHFEVEDANLYEHQRELLARADGFENFAEMAEFWTRRLKRDSHFYGQIVHWDFDERFTETSETCYRLTRSQAKRFLA